MARILTIFGPNESSRRDLFFEKFSNGRNERKYFKKFLEKFSKKFWKIFNYFSYSGGGGSYPKVPQFFHCGLFLQGFCKVSAGFLRSVLRRVLRFLWGIPCCFCGGCGVDAVFKKRVPSGKFFRKCFETFRKIWLGAAPPSQIFRKNSENKLKRNQFHL